MKANRTPRRRSLRDEQTPDGAAMLLLAGFLLAGTAIIALGAFAALQRTETQVNVAEHQSMLNLFLNTRSRAKAYFNLVSPSDTASSVDHHLDGYLASQFQTAHSLSLQLNATLAGADSAALKTECAAFLDHTQSTCPSNPTSYNYATPTNGKLFNIDGGECYSGLSYDGSNDGLITDSNGDVMAAIFWLKVQSSDTMLEEYLIIDVPALDAPSC